MKNGTLFVVVALVLAAGMVISAAVLSKFFLRVRHEQAISVKGYAEKDVVSDIGRGGMFVWTERPVELHTVARWAITLPELAATIGAEAQVLHSHTVPGAARRGLGLRFRSFDEGGEALLIRFLRAIEGGSS